MMFIETYHSPQLNPLLASVLVPVLQPASPNAAAIQHLFIVVFLICLAIVAAVAAIICVSILRFRAGNATVAAQNFGNHRSEVFWTMPPVLIVLGLAIASARLILSANAMPSVEIAGAGSADIVVVGHQWWWEVRYPASGVVTANEIHIPINRKLRVRMESADVIHSFWVPQLAPKMDTIPGHPNYLWLAADEPGIYDGACAEFCGDQHAWMRFLVVAEPSSQYQDWLTRQARPAPRQVGAVAQAGEHLFFAQTCVNCHAIGGTSAVADAAPDLTHLAGRLRLGAGIIPNTPEYLARWLRDPQQIKPGCLMPNFNLTDGQVTQLTTYLEGLR